MGWAAARHTPEQGERVPQLFRPPAGGSAFFGRAYRWEQALHYRFWSFVAIKAWIREVAGGEPPKIGEISTRKSGSKKRVQKALGGPREHHDFTPWDDEHPMVRVFNRPNHLDVAYDLWAYDTLFHMLMGESHWWVMRGPLGVVQEIWPIPPHWMQLYTGQHGLASHYYVQSPWGQTWDIPYDEIVSFYEHSPLNRYEGYAVNQAINEWIDSYEAMIRMNLAVFKNGGVPSLHVMLGDSYSDPDDAFLGRFYAKWMTRFGGENNSGRPLVTGSDITVKGIEGHRPADAIAATNAARMLSRDETLAAFGVPRACVGLTENMTFGSVKAEKDSFRENSVNSYLMYKAQVVTEKVIRPTPGCSNGIFFWDDRTSGDAEQRLRELEADLELGVRSVNEVRTADRGLEAYPLGGRNPSIRGEEKFWVEAEPRPEPEPVVELSEFELEPDGPSTIEPGVEPVLTSLGGSTGAGGGFLTRAEMLAKAIRSVSLNGHVHGRS